ncbi:hypothetical protein HOG21_00290 [bacterium]|nr:hypothetical protein [bacterium]
MAVLIHTTSHFKLIRGPQLFQGFIDASVCKSQVISSDLDHIVLSFQLITHKVTLF